MNAYLTVGVTALVGAALFEAALVPGLQIGGAAVLAPAVLPKFAHRPQRSVGRGVRKGESAAATRFSPLAPIRAAHKLEIRQSVLKTITFRVVVTLFDFGANFLILGDPTVAAGLSAISLVAGPVFYFAHETLWNYYGPAEGSIAVRIPGLRRAGGEGEEDNQGELPVSRAIAKTVTFRTAATVMDFTVNYAIVGDAATAAALSAFGFVLGPFVYLGHEMAWDAFTARNRAPLAMIAPGASAETSYGQTERQLDPVRRRREITASV
jgi:uncharacterized membrane protein